MSQLYLPIFFLNLKTNQRALHARRLLLSCQSSALATSLIPNTFYLHFGEVSVWKQYNLTLQHGLYIASILTSHELVLLLNPTDTSLGLFKTRIRFLIF